MHTNMHTSILFLIGSVIFAAWLKRSGKREKLVDVSPVMMSSMCDQ